MLSATPRLTSGVLHTSKILCRSNSSSTAAMAYKTLNRSKKRPPLPTIATPKWNASTAVSSILYETPMLEDTPQKPHVFNCLVQNEPGVLSRVSGILAARGFNIDSLVVCSTEVPDLSRMTIVLQGQDGVVEQARRQVEDLVPVWAVLDYTNAPVVRRELLLTKVSLLGPEYFEELLAHHEASDTESSRRDFHPSLLPPSEALRKKHEHLRDITNIANQFGGKIVDITEHNCVVELSAKPERISSFIALIKPFGILELARSGTMALARSPTNSSPNTEKPKQAEEVVDASTLPPG
ncbi:hypothetical protein CANCADRAFT_25439 [Tortispora caseinolytica NRRL Y-17796]|uniref:ACT domain-containing protein n=1 Tax=Tortispora caseinolytica NRRL Y-17796 TaxID=767744 RepID=A0A1E4THW7_9ASCO|nr:hypothetical protein CANCADRAFT_25439 [Tortispora caseinolytica NRRL Y-17796]